MQGGNVGIQGSGKYLNGFRMLSLCRYGLNLLPFLDKYCFETNLRAGTHLHVLKKDNRWGIFPGFSAGWRLSEEGVCAGSRSFFLI